MSDSQPTAGTKKGLSSQQWKKQTRLLSLVLGKLGLKSVTLGPIAVEKINNPRIGSYTLSRATFKWILIEKTKISTMFYKGRLIGHGLRKENTLESCARDFKLKANTFIIEILHCVCAQSCPTLQPQGL